jgi:hypothetical protein
LTAEQRAALAAFLKTAGQSLGRTNAAETSLRLMERLRCVACHDRDEKFSRWPEILATEGVQGLPPELVPDLTWAGEKLRGDWTARLLAGKLDYRARPWLHARMPAFPHYAEILAAGLAAQHGLGPSDLDRPPFNPHLAEIGETLTLKAKGLDCRQCHGLKTITAKQENNAQGISFLHVPQRVRYEYYHRWMLDPLRIDPGTKMPRFSPDHRHTPATAILGGDARRQYEALWHYLQSIPARTPAPK